jgi:hypothetical protein
MAFPRLNPLKVRSTGNSAEVATDASTYFPLMVMLGTGTVVGARFVNGTASALTSGTTTGSSASVVLYKTASNAASIIGTFNGSGTTVATLGTASILTSGTAGSTNGRFVAGDLIIGELKGGEASVVGAGAFIELEYVYSRETGSAPAAATPPA